MQKKDKEKYIHQKNTSRLGRREDSRMEMGEERVL